MEEKNVYEFQKVHDKSSELCKRWMPFRFCIKDFFSILRPQMLSTLINQERREEKWLPSHSLLECK